MSSTDAEEGVPPQIQADEVHGVAKEDGGSATGVPAVAPRLEALFVKTLAEGWLKQQVCDGMMRGMVASVRSGKRTEDECLAEATVKLEEMRKGGESKKRKKQKHQQQGSPEGGKKAGQKQSPKQQKQKLKRRAPQQILQQLGPESAPAAQLDAAKHIVAMCFQMRGQQKREYQDALTPALQPLTEMARSGVEDRAASALHALYGLCAHHKPHVVLLAETDIVKTIAMVLQAPDKSLGTKTNGCLVLNTLATNCFDTHDKIVACDALPSLIGSLTLPRISLASAETTQAASRLVDSLPTMVTEFLGGVGETQQLLVIVRGLPGSGKTHLARGIAAYLQTALICSADSYFTQEDEHGQLVYMFGTAKMKDAHAHCKMQFEEALTLGSRTIIVDNTNLRLKDYADYLARGKAAGYKPMIVQLDCHNDRDIEICYSQCVHSVPLAQIKNMAKSYQSDPSAILVESWGVRAANAQSDANASAACDAGSSAVDSMSLVLDTTATDSPPPKVESAGAQTPRRGQRVKPLRYSTVKILNALSYNPQMRETLIEAGAVDALHTRLLELTRQDHLSGGQFDHMAIVCSDEYLWTLRASIKLVGQEEVSLISEELQARGIRWLVAALSASLDGKGFPQDYSTPATPSKYAQDIACLAISDANAKLLDDLGVFALMRRTLLAEWSEQTAINMNSDPLLLAQGVFYATSTISMLSFSGLGRDGQSTREQIQSDEELMKVLNELSKDQQWQSPIVDAGAITPREGDVGSALDDETRRSAAYVETMKNTRKQAKVLLLNLKHHCESLEDLAEADGSDDTGTSATDRHIMLSYCWGQEDSNGVFPNQQLALRIREGLQRRGYRVWLDVDDLCGSTLNAMANAVEKADVVCIVMTKAYKESSPCRMEADYAYQLNGANGFPKIVPIKAERFKPDGWLGMLLGSKLYFNFYDPSKFEEELDHMVRKNFGECVHSKIGGGGGDGSNSLSPQGRLASQSTRLHSPEQVPAAAPAPGGTTKGLSRVSRRQSVDLVMPSAEASPSLSGFHAVSPVPTGHSTQGTAPSAAGVLSPASALTSEHLLSTLLASIESVERGRAAAERALEASEERVKQLEKRLADEQERRVVLLEDQMKALRLQNAVLKTDNFLQRRDPNFAANEGAAEAVQLDQWLSSLNLARYTPALVQEGYDALEFLVAASADEIGSLCVSAKLKAPHAQKLQREIASLKGATSNGADGK